jgi:hypothetical protein
MFAWHPNRSKRGIAAPPLAERINLRLERGTPPVRACALSDPLSRASNQKSRFSFRRLTDLL